MVVKRSVIAVFSARWQWAVWGASVLSVILWDWPGIFITLLGIAATVLHVMDIKNDQLILSENGISLVSRGIVFRKRNVFIPIANIQSVEVNRGVLGLLGIGDVVVHHANGVELFRFAIRPERVEHYARMVTAHSPR